MRLSRRGLILGGSAMLAGCASASAKAPLTTAQTGAPIAMPQVGLPFVGLPGLTVSTGMVGRVPVGVQVVAGRYREDLCLLAGEAIEAGGVPPSPIDPVA